jgi:hypothetical protein
MASIITRLSYGWDRRLGSTLGTSEGFAEFNVTSPYDCGSVVQIIRDI